MTEKIRKERSSLAQILLSIKPFRTRYLLGLIAFVLNESTFYVSVPLAVRLMVDAAISRDTAGLWRGIFTIMGIAGVGAVIFVLVLYLYSLCVVLITGAQRSRTFERALDLPVTYYESHHSGDTLSRLTNDLAAMKASYDWPIFNLLTMITVGLAAAVSMTILNWRVSLILIATSIFFAWLNKRFSDALKRMGKEIQESSARLTESLGNILSGFSVIKQFALEPRMSAAFGKHNEDIRDKAVQRSLKASWLECFNAIIGWINFGGLLALGAVLAGAGTMTFGTMVAMTNLLWNVNRGIRETGGILAQFQGYLAGTARVMEIQESAPETADLPSSWKTDDREEAPAIEMHGVSFSYDGKRDALTDFSLRIDGGATIGIAGPSGGGKSTALKLLLGFYEPSSGTISVSRRLLGQDARGVSREALRAMIAYVPQDPFMFSGTIAENIGHGKADADREAIEEAARAAHAHDFISALEKGYDTMVGERGLKLSGGQRQRIAIARAFLKDSPVVLLDEATSSLDSRSELAIQEALAELGKRKTVVIIAHRLSTIRDADVIYVVEKGCVAERGNHEQLIASGGLYKKLHEGT